MIIASSILADEPIGLSAYLHIDTAFISEATTLACTNYTKSDVRFA